MKVISGSQILSLPTVEKSRPANLANEIPLKILVAEDNPVFRSILNKMLQESRLRLAGGVIRL